MGSSSSDQDTGAILKIGSFNIRGALTAGKVESLCEWGSMKNMDVIAVQETNMNSGGARMAKGLKQQHYQMWWVNGAEGATRGNGVGMLISNLWWQHAGRMSSCGGRAQARDFDFQRDCKVRIINCYMPSGQDPEITENITKWIQKEYNGAREERRGVILLGDFNAVRDPRIDRKRESARGSRPETALLQWLETQPLHDVFRAVHPLREDYTCQDTSRIDMVFVSDLLADRIMKVKHKSLAGIVESDHKMVAAAFTMHGLMEQSLGGILYKKPKGYRFLFRETTNKDWEAFADDVSARLRDKNEMSTMGLRRYDPEEEDINITLEDLQRIDVERAWRWYSEGVMTSAKDNLPGKVVGKTGVKPEKELSLMHLVRDLARIKKLANSIRKKRKQKTVDEKWATLVAQQERFNEHAEWVRTTAEKELEDLTAVPGLSARDEVWKEWIKGVKRRWTISITTLQVERKMEKAKMMNDLIEKRCGQMLTETGKMIDKLLGRARGKVILDRIQDEVDGVQINILEPEELKTRVRAWFDKWHGPRPAQPLEPGSRWEKQYAPQEWIKEEWYDGMMDPPSREEFDAIVQDAPKSKAPGVSGLTNEMIQHQGWHGHHILFQIVAASIIQEQVPLDWRTGLLYCIPKTPEWSGNMAEVRPIALLEHARKIMFSVLTNRLSRIMSRHGILRGPNFSVLKGTTTKDPIHILQALMEDSREFKKEQWIVFQDMKRCFDSVNCAPDGMLSRGLRRLRVPEGFIRLCENIAVSKVNRVITEYGTTDDYHPRCGLDQGGVECPLLWRVAYDALLCEIMDNTHGYQMRGPPKTPSVADMAFVDDTTWVSDSRTHMQEILDVATSFYILNGVEINAKKTQVIARNYKHDIDDFLEFGTPVEKIRPVPKNEAVRILGVWVTAEGLPKSTQMLVEQEVETICNILRPKAITDKQTTYIINNVLIPRVLYRISAQILPPTFLQKITGTYMKLCKHKARMPSTTPNSLMHHNRLYAVKNLADAQAEEQISTLALRLNDKDLVGQICRARILMLQCRNKMDVTPTQDPGRVKRYRHNFASAVCRVMAERNFAFDVSLAPDFGLEQNALSTREWFNGDLKNTWLELASRMVLYTEQMLSENTESLMSWRDFQSEYGGPKSSPTWFNELQNFCFGSDYVTRHARAWNRNPRAIIDESGDSDNAQGDENNPSSDDPQSDESYLSSVDGETEDEEKAIIKAWNAFIKDDVQNINNQPPINRKLGPTEIARRERQYQHERAQRRGAAIMRGRTEVRKRNATLRRERAEAQRRRERRRHQTNRAREQARARRVRERERYMGLSETVMKKRAKPSLDTRATPRRIALPDDYGTPVSDVFGLSLTNETLQKIQLQREKYEGQENITLYSDGSLKETGTHNVSMSFGVVVQAPDKTFYKAISGRVSGSASSTKAELAGLLAGILISPRDKPTTIYIDNSAVVTQFRTLVQRRPYSTMRQRLRSPYATWWAAVYNAYVQQGSKVKVEWVRGHAGNQGNEEADAAARQGHFGAVWELNPSQHNDMQCHAFFNGAPAEDDLRQILKTQSVARTHHTWVAQNRTRDNIRDWKAIEWRSTLAIVHNGNTPKGLFTSPADCQKRAHRMKKLHGMLPTLSYMKHWRPDLYPTDECRVCEQEQEDTQHLWRCPTTMETQKEKWNEAVANVNNIGWRTWKKAKKKWEEEVKKEKEKGRDISGRKPPSYHGADDDTIWESLEDQIDGVAEIRRQGENNSEEEEEVDDLPDWSVQDIYHGLTPKSMADSWRHVFKTTKGIATYMAGRFVSAIEEIGRTEIWNRRCKVTVEWEKSHGITAMSKRARGRNCVEEHRRSSNDFMRPTLRQRHALNVKEIFKVADERVKDSYLGRTKLDVMERLGGCKFIMTMDCG